MEIAIDYLNYMSALICEDTNSQIYMEADYIILPKACSVDNLAQGCSELLRFITEKERAKTEAFINTEINKMLAAEKPNRIVITKPITINKAKLPKKSSNRKIVRSFNGYIRDRLLYKCRIHSIELIEINSKGTGSICSQCGAEGKRLQDGFHCTECGYKSKASLNGAKNIEIKYKISHL